MLERVDRKLGLGPVILAFPVAFLIHDAEEIATMERYVRARPLPLPAPLAQFGEVTTAQVSVAVAFEFLFTCIAALAGRSARPGPGLHLYMTAVAILFLNVFTHVGQVLWRRGYTPGAVTAVLVALPYSAYVLSRLRRAGLVTGRDLRRSLAADSILGLPLVVSALLLGRLVTQRPRLGWLRT